MWGNLSLSSLASSLTEISTQVTSTVASTANTLTSSAVHFIEDQKRSYAEEEAKIESKRQQQQYAASHTPPAALPLWHTFTEDKSVQEAELKQRILRLATDPRTFLSAAPDAALFPFSLEVALPHIQLALKNDPLLSRMQYRLVPRKVSERQFWTNYMYRVSMVREQMEVGELFEVGRVEAEVERERSREERLKAQEDAIKKDTKERQDRIRAAISTDTADMGSKESAESKQQEERKKDDDNAQRTTTTTTISSSSSSSSTKAIPAPSAAQRRDSEPDMEEFASDEYVHVAPQSAALVSSMRKDLGLLQQAAAAKVASKSHPTAGGGVSATTAVSAEASEAELDELESMLADADEDVHIPGGSDDVRDDLLEELEGELTDERNLP